MKAKEGGDEGGERFKKAIMGILLLIMVSSVIVVIAQMGSARDAGCGDSANGKCKRRGRCNRGRRCRLLW